MTPRKKSPRPAAPEPDLAVPQLQAELEVALHRYADLYEFAPVGFASLDSAGLVREINLTGTTLLGRSRRAILGVPFGSFVERKDLRRFLEHLRQCKRCRGPVATDLALRQPHGGTLIAQVVSTPAVRAARHATLYRTAITDVTELRCAQEALRQSHAELERRVADRTADLVCANALAQEQVLALERAAVTLRANQEHLRQLNHELVAEIAERQRLEGEVLEVSERERRGFGQDLHDDVCQQLAGIALLNQALATRLRPSRPAEAAEALRLSTLLGQTVADARALARGLHPIEVEAHGLMAALQELAAQTSHRVPCRLECRRPVPVADSKAALHLYRIAQEAVTNALKHAAARHIVIGLRPQRGKIILSVHDDGSGLSKKHPTGMGLHIMPYRARMIGATLIIRSEPGRGTRVVCSLKPTP